MEELYRYLLVRPAEEVDYEASVDDIENLSGNDSFQKALKDAPNQAKRSQIAKQFIETDSFIKSAEQVPHGAALIAVADYYRNHAEAELVDLGDVLSKVAEILVAKGDSLTGPTELTSDAIKIWLPGLTQEADWEATRVQLRNSMLAIRESNEFTRNLLTLVSMLQVLNLIKKIAATAEEKVRPGAFIKAAFYLTGIREGDPASELKDNEKKKKDTSSDSIIKEFKRLSKAADELLGAPLSRMQVKMEEMKGQNEAGKEDTERSGDETMSGRVVRLVRLSAEAHNRLTAETQIVMKELNISHKTESLDSILDIIRTQQQKSMAKLFKSPVKLYSGTWMSKDAISFDALTSFHKPGWLHSFVPKTTGQCSPVGIGDLLVVRQNLKRYQGGDVAHIENILQGEKKEREHRRRRLNENIFVEESETETSEERETQTTSRYEMSSEVQKQAQEEFGLNAGVNVSASYGPVSIETNTDFAYKNAKTESRKRAVSSSKELVDKASSKYREKVREQITRRVLEEAEETNRHSLDATSASEHIVGVYQWVNKVYEAQVYNYGLRVMYDFMVAEPASYFIWSLGQKADETEGLVVPPPFDFSAADVNEWNYKQFAAVFGASNIDPPPEPFITVAIHKSQGPNPEKGPMNDSDAATIPDGYEYYTHTYDYGYSYKKSDPTNGFAVEVSSAFKNPGSVPVIFHGYSITGWTAYVHFLCRRTQRAYENWRQQTWESLHQAHLQQMASYEEKLAAIMAQKGVVIKGRNPYFNRRTERNELQKVCITLLTGTYPSWLNGIDESIAGPVPINIASKTQGAYVRFMEHAFEWERMTYLFYPYFWARSSKWLELLSVEDIDPMFQDFLKAGYARVVVPVRPGFEQAVEHFRQTGQIWSGGKLPDITDPDYLPIALEIKQKQDAPGDEEPVGDPWEVVVPTQLVKLREGNDLPKWEKQPDGTWQEV